MRTPCWLIAALWLAGISSAHAQRRIRIGPTYSSLALDDGSGSSHSFSSFGGSAALITGDDGEAGLSIAGYNDLSTDKRSEEHTSELQSRLHLVCRLLLEKKKNHT